MADKDTITWIKPNGNEIETNALKATIEYCASLGWTPVGAEDEKPAKKPRGRPKKSAE